MDPRRQRQNWLTYDGTDYDVSISTIRASSVPATFSFILPGIGGLGMLGLVHLHAQKDKSREARSGVWNLGS
ncbi:MAG: hypothetical protein ACLQGP_12350 [Isosphaeraceae bacterium]